MVASLGICARSSSPHSEGLLLSEIPHLIEDHIRETWVGAYGAAIEKLAAPQLVGIAAEDIALAGCRADIFGDAQ
jgi:hypothetical protein